jgi:catechol 2,3-dioxygenase-like lactoylglutathione lyase family enzyme
VTARGIDHLVLAVRDLDRAARLYEGLGFQVGSRNRHPWGTENRLVQFDGSFLELITVGEGADIPEHRPQLFSFGAFLRDYLARREGLALLVLDSQDARADAAAFAIGGLGSYEPFFFERRGRRPDGSEVHVAFTLAFAIDAHAPQAGFFVCQQHRPDQFWNPGFQQHANRAAGIDTVLIAAREPALHRPFLERFSGGTAESVADEAYRIPLARGRIDVVTPDDAAVLLGSVETDGGPAELVGFGVRVESLRTVALKAAGLVPLQEIGSRLVVPASAAHGVAIAFEAG